MRKLLNGLTALFLLASLTSQPVNACSKYQPPSMCGVCPTGCVYVVFCGINLNGISFCDGTSPGNSYNSGITDDPNSTVSGGPLPGLCGAYVTLTGVCCGGARTFTVDATPILEMVLDHPCSNG